VEGPAWMTRQPFLHLRALVSGVVVEDRVDALAGGNFALDSVEETDELLMPMALHVSADHRAVEDIHRRKQGGMVSARPFFIGRPDSVERLDLALLIDGQDNGMGRWIDIEPDHIAQFVDEVGVVG
jgi:hypothetical protein